MDLDVGALSPGQLPDLIDPLLFIIPQDAEPRG